MPVQKEFLVLRSFDWTPRPNVIRAFKAGTTVRGLTAACIKKGSALNALKRIQPEEQSNGKTDDL